jgi:predicted ATPase
MKTVNDSILYSLKLSKGMLDALTADLKDGDWDHRAVPGSNCAAWLVGHLILVERRALGLAGLTILPELPAGFETAFGREGEAPKAASYGDSSNLIPMFDSHRDMLVTAVANLPPTSLRKPCPSPARGFRPSVNSLHSWGCMSSCMPVKLARSAGVWADHLCFEKADPIVFAALACMTKPISKIVLTGGPGAGKTIIAQDIARRFPDRFVLVPEAATHVYGALNTRWDRLDLEGKRNVQRQIYHHQLEQEHQFQFRHPDKILLLDRGTLDGAAYWPDGIQAYWDDLRTSVTAELARYDAIIWLQTAAALGLYDGDASNTCRFEDPSAAIQSGIVLNGLWGNHPHIDKVDAYPHLAQKISAVEKALWRTIETDSVTNRAVSKPSHL